MTPKQTILKALYPLITGVSKLFGSKATVALNKSNALPKKSIFDLGFTDNKGKPVALAQFRGKKMLLVNTASNCGYTAQYDELQELFKRKQDELVIIAFPSNDFQDQEKGDDKEIEEFCRLNYGVTFPLATKSVVVKSKEQDPVFHWLTDPSSNGWNSQPPEWNFSKYLINENGTLLGYYGSAISPLDDKILARL